MTYKGKNIRSSLNQKSAIQMFRYIVLGILMNSLGYLLYLTMTYSGIDPKLAMSIGYMIGLSVSFIGNRKWTFSHDESLSWAVVRFFGVHLLGYLFNLVCLYVFVDIYDLTHYIVQLCVMIVLTGYFFVALKFFVFASPMFKKMES